jgi:shikimate dehydrogenase
MHNAAIAALGLDAVYVALQVDPADLPVVFGALEAMGIAGNVTVPHKVAAAGVLQRLSPIANELQAVNTFWAEDGALVGDNTDVPGLQEVLQDLEAEGPWLVAGTGGAARAVAAAARERRQTLLVSSRTSDGEVAFIEWARSAGVRAESDDGRRVGLAVNTTPLGLSPDDSRPFAAARLEKGTVALDLVYAPGATEWVRACRMRGLRAEDGRRLLVAQGAIAFERFFPGANAPREVMLAAVERALAA